MLCGSLYMTFQRMQSRLRGQGGQRGREDTPGADGGVGHLGCRGGFTGTSVGLEASNRHFT